MSAIAEQMLSNRYFTAFKPMELATALWAFGSLQIPHERLVAAVADAFTAPGALRAFSPQDTTQLCWVLATLRLRHTDFLEVWPDTH